MQGLRISYTHRSANLHAEYESSAWKVSKDDTVGIEDPKCPNHPMSAARYALTPLVREGNLYDPERETRQRNEVSVTRQRLTKNQSR